MRRVNGSLVVVLVVCSLACSAYGQLNVAGAYQRAITMGHNNVYDSDQTDFPVLISGTFAYLANTANGGNVQNPNGYDILFSSDPEAQQLLDFEIDSYDPATGTVNFWVRIPTLSHEADTAIYMTYGISGVTTSYENKAGVWKNNYLSVYHFGDGANISLSDSGSAGYALTGSPAAIQGRIGGGVAFSGDPNVSLTHESVPAYPTGNSAVTLEGWASMTGGSGAIVGYGENTYNGSRVGLGSDGSHMLLEFENYGLDGDQPADTQWHQFVGVYGGGGPDLSTSEVYIDGTSVATSAWGSTPSITATELKIGGVPTVTFCCAWVGSIDEVRISAGTRSPGWIKTEYANQSAPSSFYTVSGSPTATQLSPSNGMAGTWVTITGTNFGSAQLASTVTFNGTPTIAQIWSDTYLKVLVPDGATSGNVVVTVNGAPSNGLPFTIITIKDGLTSLAVSAASGSVQAGNSQAYSAIATYSDGSTQDVTSVATWSASDPTVAAVDSTGVVQAIDNGTATIQASLNGVTGATTLTVTPGPLDVVLTPVYPVYPTTGTNAESGQKTIAIAPDGFARFVVVNSTQSGWDSGNDDDEAVYVRCLDQDCTTSHTATFPIGNTIANYSMALGPDGYARIATTYVGGVGLIQCGDDDCSSSSNSLVDTNGTGKWVGNWVSVAVGASGQSFVLYDKQGTGLGGNNVVNLATCSGSCGIAKIADIPWYDNDGGAVTLGADGNPAVLYEDSGSSIAGTQDSVHYYANGSDVVVSSNGSGGFWVQDLSIGPDGFARLAYINNQGGVDFIQCADAACGAHSTTTIPSSGAQTEAVSVAVASDGTGLLQTLQINSDNTQFWWDYIQCATADCSKYSDQIAPGALASSHDLISLALDQNGGAHMIAQAASGGDGPSGSGAVVEHGLVAQGCPREVTYDAAHDTQSIALEGYPFNHGLRTGVGIHTTMRVDPSTNPSNGKNWNNTVITESVGNYGVPSGCPTTGQDTQHVVGCNIESSPFQVGCIYVDGVGFVCKQGASDNFLGAPEIQIDNAFSDYHVRKVPPSVLAPGQECKFSCTQVYYCGKKVVGVFNIDYDLQGGTYNSTPVTRVFVNKHK